MVWSPVYLAVRKVLALIVLVVRSDRSKELEILLLRRELLILRRHPTCPLRPQQRALLSHDFLPQRASSVRPSCESGAVVAPDFSRFGSTYCLPPKK